MAPLSTAYDPEVVVEYVADIAAEYDPELVASTLRRLARYQAESGRTCSVCRAKLPLAEYARDVTAPSGLDATCKGCRRAARNATRGDWPSASVKCSGCRKVFDAEALGGKRTCPACRERAKAHAAAARERDPEGVRAAERAGRRANPAASRATDRRKREGYAARSPEEVAAARLRLRPAGTKRCRACDRGLPLGDFAERSTTADGLQDECRGCRYDRTARRLVRRCMARWEELDLWACAYCGHPWEHVDHVLARSRGGSDEPENLVPACAECNLSKNDRPVVEWFTELRNRAPALSTGEAP